MNALYDNVSLTDKLLVRLNSLILAFAILFFTKEDFIKDAIYFLMNSKLEKEIY